jgi:hypothetical protein
LRSAFWRGSNPQKLLLTKAKQGCSIFFVENLTKLKPCKVNQCKVLIWVGGGVDKFFRFYHMMQPTERSITVSNREIAGYFDFAKLWGLFRR